MNKKNKAVALVLAWLLGGVGGHWFYLGKIKRAVLYLVFFWTVIPAFLAIYDFFVMVVMSQKEFDAKYNKGVK